MSQAGLVDIESSHPQIPTEFVANVGTAVPIANVLELLGEVIAAGSVPFESVASGNTVTYQVQFSQAIASTDATKVGLASFDSGDFTVDANGFVQLTGGGSGITKVNLQTGTTPIVPSSGAITFNGSVVSAGTNPVRTDGTGANTMALEVQISQAIVSTDATKIGLAAFDSARFTVDANGFVTINGAGVAETITGNSGGALSPTSGNWNILGTGSITTSGSVSTLTVQLTGLTNHAVLVGAGTSTITSVGPTATSGQILQSQGSLADPAFSTATYPSTTTINDILYSSSTNVVGQITAVNSAVLVSTSTGVPQFSGTMTNGQVIIGSTGATPTAATLTAGTGISITNAAGSITIAVSGSIVGETITGNTGGALSPTAGNWNIVGTGSTTAAGSGSTLTVQLTGLTNHALQIGAGTATLTQLGAGTTGQILQTNTTADPTWSTATYPSTTTISQILYSSATNVVSGLATANSAALVTTSTGVPVMSATMTNGQMIIGSTGATPAAGTITSTGGTVTVTVGAGTLNLEVAGGGFTWTDVTSATQAMLIENGYITDRSAGVVYTLPASAVLGAKIIVMGKLGITTITPNANQQILMSSASGTVGVTGTVVGTNVGDCVTLVATTSGASTIWRAESFVGNWTVN